MQRVKQVRPFTQCLAVIFLSGLLMTPLDACARPAARQQVVVSPDATLPARDAKPAVSGRSLVTAPSALVGQGGVTRLNFSGALSIHNTSSTHALTIEKIDYRNDAGALIESCLDAPVTLKPYASMQVVIAQDDMRGGPGASFTIDWATPAGADEPVVEAFIASFVGTHSYSFTTAGRRVTRPQ